MQVITVGLGSAENARFFSQTLDYPLDNLYADPTSVCYKALGFSPGFAPGSDINPYVKLLTMLAGIGSPGTVQEVGFYQSLLLKTLGGGGMPLWLAHTQSHCLHTSSRVSLTTGGSKAQPQPHRHTKWLLGDGS